ncbi:phosphotransferase [Pseudomonas sp. JQ170]|uniref:phosphotransferase n=1 Tax=unclassified Pseudomonas TaxID=196821 RepID=UPI0026558EDB|nr:MULTISPECIES: phosphotransferase [unclassified Pseudomonas]MDN7142939.1 phosphotransferase [Pseudomonas sp. JQ170]WRO74563.1 phosphotransferase [Pseudomonas sp. 170C]
MNLDLHPLQGCRTVFRWQQGHLEHHLHVLLPQWREHPLAITSQDLASNASFVNYVRHHQLVDPCTGQQVELVEKSIRKIAFIGSQEARFYRAQDMLTGSVHFQYPACLGIVETPWESLVFTEFVRGKPPRMHAIARQLASGIVELENLSHRYLSEQPLHKAPLFWSMDFFRPWFLLRPRFNFARCLPELERLGQSDECFTGLAKKFNDFTPLLSKLESAARRSPRCISHMDYLRKNLFVDEGKLLLIDWSEVKIGRVGFDGGAYLGSLFRRKDMKVFLAAQQEFIEAYHAALPHRFDSDEALRNLNYMFLLTALYHCLRPETIEEYQTKQRMPVLREKYDYLLSLL